MEARNMAELLPPDAVVAQVKAMRSEHEKRSERYTQIRNYLHDENEQPWIPRGAPWELRQLALLSRVNVLRLVVDTVAQSMFVDGFRGSGLEDNEAAWQVWQANRFDARQIGVHRAALAYGEAYVSVVPGTLWTPSGEQDMPVLRGASPRQMTASWGDDDEWPMWALEKRRNGVWRLYDDTAYYDIVENRDSVEGLSVIGFVEHGAGVCPVVRYRASVDLDDEAEGCPWGEINESLMHLQDQINATTFGLLVAQHYGAFRQRYIIGWLAEDENAKLKASASKLWTFEDAPQDVQVGEFGQTELSGYIESREASIRHLAAVSQTPAHELIGELINLSAEALAAAEASQRRKITERQTTMGESHEQMLELAARMNGTPAADDSYVRWRDTEARSMAATVDALGKLVQMLGVPPQEVWDMVPGITPQQVERWKAAAANGDALANLTSMLEGQANAGAPPVPEDDEGL
jgi:hypothetical protein